MSLTESQNDKFRRLYYDVFLKLPHDQRTVVSSAYARLPDGTGSGDSLEMALRSLEETMIGSATDYEDILAGQAIYEALEG